MPTIDDDAREQVDSRGVLDRLLLLALEDAADRTYRLHAGAPAPFVTQVLCAELEVDGFLAPGDGLQLSDELGRAVAAAAESIAAGRRPVPERSAPGPVEPVGPAGPVEQGQRSTER